MEYAICSRLGSLLTKTSRCSITSPISVQEESMPQVTAASPTRTSMHTSRAASKAAAQIPFFGVPDGGLVFNWWYSNNGARIANPAGYKNPYALPGTGENNDDVHGLGNEFGANTEGGEGSDSYWHDAAELSGDCHGGSCKVVGTDRGGSMPSGPCWGSYAIYVSTSANAFVCQ